MIPAVKHFDPVMGVDIHILIVPMVGPVPIPHPHIAMIMDPMDYVPIMGSTVNVGFMPRGTAGTAGKTIPHIPMGAPFAKPPMNESEIFMGSATVLADGSPMTFTALPVLSCHDIGMISPPRKKPKKTYGMVMPTSLVTAIPAGLPVLVGGPPTIDMMGVAMAGGMKALGGAFGKLRKLQKGSKRVKKVSDAIHNKAKKAMDKLGVPPNVQNKVHKGICTITGHPVDVAAGKLFTDDIDIELPGPLPFKWERTWFSTSTYSGPLGHGWHHSYDVAMAIENNAIAVRMADGRPVVFPLLREGESAFNRQERCTLIRDSMGYAMDTADKLRYRFNLNPASNGTFLLQSITEKTLGSSIGFRYSLEGCLTEIKDSVGRYIRFENDDHGRIKKIFLPTPELNSAGNSFCAIEYHYQGDELVSVEDALKQQTKYRYDNHLLVQETLKNGLNFYFRFDGIDHTARCIETWGDKEIYYRKLEYDRQKNITKVYDSHGYVTSYHHDNALPFKIINPKGFESFIEYNNFAQIVKEIDEVGGVTQYEYDFWGNKVKESLPGGAVTELAFDENQNLTKVIDPVGATWRYHYNSQNQLKRETNPLGRITEYRYGQLGVVGVTDAAGNQFDIGYDLHGNVNCISDQTGLTTRWDYDGLGRLLEVIDPKNNKRKFNHDELGRVIKIIEPDSNIRNISYDANDNVCHISDKQTEIFFQYCGLNRLAERQQGGVALKFEYDTEEQLIGITNEKGRIYKFQYDALGDLQRESGFDDLIREYYRDPLGRVSRIQRPGGRFSEYAYDEYGNIKAIKHNDGFLESYDYLADGTIVGAKNPHVSLGFERNALGLVEKELQGDHWISSEYDALGNRTKIISSLGLNQKVTRNSLGDVEKVSLQEDQYQVDFNRDQLGLEMERSMPGGIRSRWQRDNLGRPLKQEISLGAKVVSTKSYVWGVNNRLQKIIDKLGNETVFKHDTFGNLICAEYASGEIEWRMPDAVGNLFKKQDQSDREYGPAGQLLSIKEKDGVTRFEYDPEGNLVRKTLADGKQWLYRWNGVGMLAKVIRPDGDEVEFHYDPLGRRIAKIYRKKITRWVWDGNNPLHEWVEYLLTPAKEKSVAAELNETADIQQRNSTLQPISNQGPPEGSREALITWIFEPESHIPMAKMHDGNYFSIVTDYVGTPNAMFDENGECVWSGELDTWGNLKNVQGEDTHCPFRWQGQYEDVETGLYYNRFRYFDPNLGRYLSQDPIGLLGGFEIYGYVSDPAGWIDPLGLASCKSASENLPQLRGKSVSEVEKILKKNGFVQTKVSASAAKNQTWKHADGSEVRIHPYGNVKDTMKSGAVTPKSGLNAHVHKQDPAKNQLTDRGVASSNLDETHIGIKNPQDLPTVRGRPHGSGA